MRDPWPITVNIALEQIYQLVNIVANSPANGYRRVKVGRLLDFKSMKAKAETY
jgi:hypothetical protein